MGMYNLIFGESGNADKLLMLLGLSRDNFYRYRDCYLDEKSRIAVYTRGGGNNRQCYCHDYLEPGDERVMFDGEEHQPDCVVIAHDANCKHPCYLYDKDDSFDNTYATFYFRVPEEVDKAALAEIEPEISRGEAWDIFLTELQKASLASGEDGE